MPTEQTSSISAREDFDVERDMIEDFKEIGRVVLRLKDARERLEMDNGLREKLREATDDILHGSWKLLTVLEGLGLASSE